jgi:hypothetical protein
MRKSFLLFAVIYSVSVMFIIPTAAKNSNNKQSGSMTSTAPIKDKPSSIVRKTDSASPCFYCTGSSGGSGGGLQHEPVHSK